MKPLFPAGYSEAIRACSGQRWPAAEIAVQFRYKPAPLDVLTISTARFLHFAFLAAA
jgi:hypothetical protein